MRLLVGGRQSLAGFRRMETLLPLTLFCFTAVLVNVCRLR
jgi:hypothetical protein